MTIQLAPEHLHRIVHYPTLGNPLRLHSSEICSSFRFRPAGFRPGPSSSHQVGMVFGEALSAAACRDSMLERVRRWALLRRQSRTPRRRRGRRWRRLGGGGRSRGASLRGRGMRANVQPFRLFALRVSSWPCSWQPQRWRISVVIASESAGGDVGRPSETYEGHLSSPSAKRASGEGSLSIRRNPLQRSVDAGPIIR